MSLNFDLESLKSSHRKVPLKAIEVDCGHFTHSHTHTSTTTDTGGSNPVPFDLNPTRSTCVLTQACVSLSGPQREAGGASFQGSHPAFGTLQRALALWAPVSPRTEAEPAARAGGYHRRQGGPGPPGAHSDTNMAQPLIWFIVCVLMFFFYRQVSPRVQTNVFSFGGPVG